MPADPNLPRLERFQVLSALGSGGMADVFLALQKTGTFQRPVALKCLARAAKEKDGSRDAFLREASITAGLSHPGIVKLYDLHVEDDDLYMVMEFVPGATLRELTRFRPEPSKPLPVPLIVAVLREVAAALHAAHTFKDPLGGLKPVIHRDVNERNIMLAFDGAVRLLDFGIARQEGLSSQTRTGMVKGTLGYFAPEQLAGEVADPRADIFSLGVVAWQCLTGRVLYDIKNDLVQLHTEIKKPVPPPSQHNKAVPPALDKVVLKALVHDKDARIQSAEAFLRELDKAAADAWSAQQRAALVSDVFSLRRAELAQLIQTASKGDRAGFEDKLPTEPATLADMSSSGSITARLKPEAPTAPAGRSVLNPEAKTVPAGFHEIDTTPAPSVLNQRPVVPTSAPRPPSRWKELARRWPWGAGLATLGALLGWLLAHCSSA